MLLPIATFQAPGRYFLRPGVEIGSSPEDNRHPLPAHDEQQSAPDGSFRIISDANEQEEQAELDSKYEKAPNLLAKGDMLHHSTDLFGEKKSYNNEAVGSSSDSGSESDSESYSSDSGSKSGSRSRSRSRSPMGSGSGSSNDSESDASTISKEASDADVDIMTRADEKQAKHVLQAFGFGASKSPLLWITSDGEPADFGRDEKLDGHVSDAIEIEKDLPKAQLVGGMATVSESVLNKGGQKPIEETTPSLNYHHEDQERRDYKRKGYRETGNMPKDGFNNGQFDSCEKVFRDKYKRVSYGKNVDDKPDCSKRLKSGNSYQPQYSGSKTTHFEDSHQSLTPDRPFENLDRGPNNQMANTMRRDANPLSGSQKGNVQTSSTKSNICQTLKSPFKNLLILVHVQKLLLQ